jgi:hypothetical protein
MKKFLLTFLIVFSCLAMSAQRYLSTAERDETTVKPAQMMTRTVETQSDGVIVTYQINAVSLKAETRMELFVSALMDLAAGIMQYH